MELLCFAAIRAIYEVTAKQRDAACLSSFQDADECPLAREAFALVVHADEVTAGLIVDRFCDLCRGQTGQSESLDGFHMANRITPLRSSQHPVTTVVESGRYDLSLTSCEHLK